MRDILKSFLSLLLLASCPLCQRSAEQVLCSDCERQVRACQQPQMVQSISNSYPVFVWGFYQSQLKRAIAAMKYQGHPQLGEWLGIELGQAWLAAQGNKHHLSPIVVPIPLHRERLRTRGFNQAQKIAQGFCQITRYRCANQGLLRVRETPALFSLTPQERQATIHDAFQLGPDLARSDSQRPILLIDDIYTTGTTTQEAIRILHRHKIQLLGVAAIAKPPSLRD